MLDVGGMEVKMVGNITLFYGCLFGWGKGCEELWECWRIVIFLVRNRCITYPAPAPKNRTFVCKPPPCAFWYFFIDKSYIESDLRWKLDFVKWYQVVFLYSFLHLYQYIFIDIFISIYTALLPFPFLPLLLLHLVHSIYFYRYFFIDIFVLIFLYRYIFIEYETLKLVFQSMQILKIIFIFYLPPLSIKNNPKSCPFTPLHTQNPH